MPPASLTRVCEFSTQFGATTVTVMFCMNPLPRQKIKIRHGTDGKSADGATPGFQYLRSTGSCGCTRRTNLVASKQRTGMCVTQFLQIENKVAVTKRYTVLELHVLCPFGLCFALAKHCQSRSPFRGTCDQQRWINAVA